MTWQTIRSLNRGKVSGISRRTAKATVL